MSLAWATALRARARLATAEWAEENVYLSQRVPTPQPGQWRRSSVAALCAPGGPLEALDDPLCETVVVMKGSQLALTTSAYVWLAKEQATDPGSALIVMNSTQDARDKSSETWRPMIEDSQRIAWALPHDRKREWTKLYQLVNHSPVYWIGANSPGRLGAKPIRRLILDEVDKYPAQFGASGRRNRATTLSASEAGAAALARQRTKAFRQSGLAKILEFSTPTDDRGEIHKEYLIGDQRQFWFSCPHCKRHAVLDWKHFVIDMTLAKTDPAKAVGAAHFRCPNCKAAWTDADRYHGIDGGEWRPTVKPQDPKCRSYRAPSWVSKFVTHNYLAAQWIRAQKSRSGLQDFLNSESAEPFVHIENAIKDGLIASLEGEYSEGELFASSDAYRSEYAGKDSAVIAGVDVQKGYLVTTFRQWTAGGDSGLLWHGTVSGFKALDRLAEQYQAQFIFMDRRYRQREVDEWAETHSGYIPCEGVTSRAKSIFTLNSIDLEEGRSTRTGARVISILSHDANQLKDVLAELMQHAERTGKRWLVPRGYGTNPDYCAQMTAERCINGVWVNPQDRPNHAWDSEVLCVLGAIWCGWLDVGQDASNNENDIPEA